MVKEISVEQIEMVRNTLLSLYRKKVVDFFIYTDGSTSTILNTEFFTAQQTTQIVTGGGYTHTQTAPSATWTINHNLGYRPDIQVSTPGGSVIFAEINHMSLNQARVVLNSPISGVARCT